MRSRLFGCHRSCTRKPQLPKHKMPPKSPPKKSASSTKSSGKPPKKPPSAKLSKAEKEKLQKEEEERKLKEEEEARKKAEEEERERLEKERIEREERERLEREEHERHDMEMADLNAVLDNVDSAINSQEEQRRANAKWERYMKCDGSPDPTVTQDINTYMSLWREDKDNSEIKTVLQDSRQLLALIGELEFLMSDTPEGELSESDLGRYRQTIRDLQELLSYKLDEATVDMLKKATAEADIESGNLQKVSKLDDIIVMLWANLNKNPRFKSFEFPGEGFTFELPKPLATADVGIRVIKTAFDHLSPHCRTFYPRKKKVDKSAAPEEEEEKKEEEDTKDGEEGEKEGEDEEKPLDADDEDAKSVASGRKSTTSAAGSTREKEEGENEGKEGEEKGEAEEGEEKEGEGEDKKPTTAEAEEEEELLELDEDVIDLRQFSPLGGVMYMELLQLPPQPVTARGWSIVEVVDENLRRIPYPGEPEDLKKLGATLTLATPAEEKPVAKEASQAQMLLEGPPKDGAAKEGAEGEGEQPAQPEGEAAPPAPVQPTYITPPVGVTIKLPSTVAFYEEPQPARWSWSGKHWRLDGFTDIKYDEENKTLSFKTNTFGLLTVIQDSHLNMPFQSWEIRPRGNNAALFTIIAAIVELEIEIKDDKCCLSQPEDTPELDHLRKKWMAPKDLVKALRAAGVNIFPEPDSSKFVSMTKKDEEAEMLTYRCMAMTLPAFAFSWSKWNAEAGEDRIVMQAAEHLEDEPVNEDDWCCYVQSVRRAKKLKINEFSEEFSVDHAEGSELRSNMYHMLTDSASEKARERIQAANFRFLHCAGELIRATRLFTYS
ncbi:PREDICTED: axonemal 84 kDa protein-like [Branchiostoma belcheri]|uniref:Axonemal 84 kDa protein-like n=1 Tax=Branchiostoma belcheri TaxID=7741 RepID=A0A6P4ZA07_BRABE|nr:PREDICTED: axonemal 84 kDa protein-like [Branchiostoma belcheri]